MDRSRDKQGGSRGRRSVRRRAGFSLIEALVVLLVAGMAIMLVFAIGGQSARTGFSLGRRALSVADAQLNEDQLRGIVRGLVLAPRETDPKSLGLAPLRGDQRSFRGSVLLDRAGLCGAAGPAGEVTVALETRPGGDAVTCQSGSSPAVLLDDLSPRRAGFSYSIDGVRWTDTISPPPATGASPGATAVRSPQTVYIRLASTDGRIDIVEKATSGPVWLYPTGPRAIAAGQPQ
ncbi:MAG TPA: hypothetical protein VGI95_08710 [Caulobacteraceae bacterium]